MPTYVYETIPDKPRAKPRRFEVVQKMTDPPLTKDPKTGLPVRRIVTGGSGTIFGGVSVMAMNNVKRPRR